MKTIFTITKAELPLALSMFSYFFLVITSFWILKPIKKGLFIQYYDQSGCSTGIKTCVSHQLCDIGIAG